MMERRLYTVSELTDAIRQQLEDTFALVWLCGEISNLRRPPSGHAYFTLKDAEAQISAVMFRGVLQNLVFDLQDGLSITGLGRIGVYAPRGTYQIILEYLEPQGAGALQLAFEQLKQKLAAEGLFDAARKKPLPFLPGKISVITSPGGAVVHDIIQILARRFPNMAIEIVPVKVQGMQAAGEIVAAFNILNQREDTEVIILARGGGSLEDLQPFNSEAVARAIFQARAPVISAVGHETDVTIADFVADVRAPTPSAAAELVVPAKRDLQQRIRQLETTLARRMQARLNTGQQELKNLQRRLIHPRRRLQDQLMRTDELYLRLQRAVAYCLAQARTRLTWQTASLQHQTPGHQIQKHYLTLKHHQSTLHAALRHISGQQRNRLATQSARLAALSPLSILQRGYSITRRQSDQQVLMDATAVTPEQSLEIILARGTLICRVERTQPNGPSIL